MSLSAAPKLNTALVRRRRAELGMSARAMGDLLGIPSISYTAIENGHGTDRLELRLLVRLSRALGVSLDELVTAPDVDRAEAPNEPTADNDGAALGALLFAVGSQVPSGAICEALGWDFERLRVATEYLERALTSCVLVLRRTNARLQIARGESAVDPGALKITIRRQLGREQVSLSEARMLRRVEQSALPQQPSNPETVTLGILVNSELVSFGENPTKQTEAPMVLSDDVRYSLFLDEPLTGK